ncbi:MAG: shikimate kinase [Evtepia gabavorous]
MHNVILIGMPGVGKSTLGVLLAKTLGMTFLDTDLVIQDQKKALLRELIAQHGIDGFLALEGTVCAGLQAENAVIATGGSVVYEPEAMAHLREIGTVVYLKLGYKAGPPAGQPQKPRGGSPPGPTLRMLYEQRIPLYETYAHITVDCGGQDIEHTLDRVLRALEKAQPKKNASL